MTQVTLNIPKEQYNAFMDVVKSMNLKVVRKSAEESLSTAQKKTWKNIKKGFEELKMIEEGKMKVTSMDDYLEELKKEGYL